MNFHQDDMPGKPRKAELPRPASANANASGDSPSKATSDDDDLPLMWEKVSNKNLKHINDRFDKLEQTLQAVQNSQTEMLDRWNLLRSRCWSRTTT